MTKQLILAIQNGDCYTDYNYNSGKARLDIYHSKNNEDLIFYKKKILDSMPGVRTRVVKKVDDRKLKSGKIREGLRLQTNFSHHFFNNAKPFKFVAKQLVKPNSLALLWMDDGTICRKGANFSSATLAVDDWPEWKVDELRKHWNKMYGWCPVKMKYKCREKKYWRLRLVKQQMVDLTKVIEPFVVESMRDVKLWHN